MRVVIPAAGLGSRFLPVTSIVPKELLPLGTKPLIQHAVEEAERAGFDEILVVISPDKRAIARYFQAKPRLAALLARRGETAAVERLRETWALADRLRLVFVEQPRPLGLGDAVLRCAERLEGEPFAVLLPDDVLPGAGHWRRLRALHERRRGACLCLRRVPAELVHRFGVAAAEVSAGGELRVRALVEKPAPGAAPSDLVVLGRYLFTPEALVVLRGLAAASRPGELQLTAALDALARTEPGLHAVLFDGVHFDCGTPADHARAVAAFPAQG